MPPNRFRMMNKNSWQFSVKLFLLFDNEQTYFGWPINGLTCTYFGLLDQTFFFKNVANRSTKNA